MDHKKSTEEQFRSSLDDVLEISKKLSNICQTPAQMCEMIELALNNDGQLRLLMAVVFQGRK